MHESSYAKMGAFVAHYLADQGESRLNIVDIGSRSVLGHQTYRDLFACYKWQFHGLDIEPGNNVDIVVSDPYHWRDIESASLDVAISGQALEHVEFPWKTFEEIFRILKPGGLFCLIVPSSGEEHRYPVDCWRFYPDSMHALGRASGFAVVEVFTDFGFGNWQDTFAVFQKPGAVNGGGASFPTMTNRDAAFSEYWRALTTRPRSPAYYLNLAGELRKRSREEDAITACRVGLDLFPNNVSLRQEVATALLNGGEVIAAAEHAATLLSMRPIQPASVDVAGSVFEALNEKQRSYYASLLPTEAQPNNRIANLAMESKRYQLASICWGALESLEPDDENHGHRRCLALLGAGDYEKATGSFRYLRDQRMAKKAVIRTTVVQRLINAMNAKRYLEIGVEQGINFFQIDADLKYAVDPEFKIPGGACSHVGEQFFEMPSDDFFASVPEDIRDNGIDVALVDGLHTYEQALRDVENCLRYLSPGGVIVMHDCLPGSAVEAAPTLEAARAMPGFKNAWTGDVYKAVVHLRATHNDLFVAVIDSDHGIGIVCRGDPESTLDMTPEKISSLSFQELKASTGRLLNLKAGEWFDSWLSNYHG